MQLLNVKYQYSNFCFSFQMEVKLSESKSEPEVKLWIKRANQMLTSSQDGCVFLTTMERRRTENSFRSDSSSCRFSRSSCENRNCSSIEEPGCVCEVQAEALFSSRTNGPLSLLGQMDIWGDSVTDTKD